MTNETINYVEAVNGREWSHDDQSRKDFDFLVRSLPIDMDRDLLEPFDFLKELDEYCGTFLEPIKDDLTEFLERYSPTIPCIDVAY